MTFYHASLGIILLIGTLVVWEDVKNKKIKNKWIVIGFVSGVVLLFSLYPFNLVNFDYLAKVGINTFISLIVGFIIWKLGLWPAGDAKFFALISFLLPLHYYRQTYLEYFPSFVLLVNIFILFLFFLFFKSSFVFFSTPKKNIKAALLFLNRESIKKLFMKIIIGLLVYFLAAKFVFNSDFKFFSFFVFFLAFLILEFLLNNYTSRRIGQAVPFAVWIFFGAILTVFIQASAISFIYSLF